jgi:hypothetical protein
MRSDREGVGELKRRVFITAALLALLSFAGSAARAEGPNAIITSAGCQTTELAANDDGSSPRVTLPFTINYFGNEFSSLFVNNNGNVTFDTALSTFTPFPLLTTNRAIIAAFFADVDTRGTGSGTTHYGAISAGETQIGGHPAFCVNWVNVGYFGGHVDKRNSFQLVLIDRSDTGSGNFDIMFNYDKIQWETGDASGGSGGLGGSSARVGYSNGTNASFELSGSAVNGSFLDTNLRSGLIYNNVGSPLQDGRYIFPVRNGAATGHSISGHILRDPGGTAVSDAFIQACPTPADTPCRLASSGADGSYSLNNLPDHTSGTGVADHDWNLVVNPPSGSDLSGATAGPITVNGSDVTGQDVTLRGPTPLSGGATLTTASRGTATSGTPTVYWQDTMTIHINGCSPGTGTATLLVQDGYEQIVSLTPDQPGTYAATFAAPYPHHGNATISWTLDCGTTGSFDIYLDPSGVVKTVGGTAIGGVTVTLYRADDSAGPFVQVPNGSAIMSPGNRVNPDTTDATGHFGWDVLSGFYKVRAAKDGCTGPGGAAFVESAVLTIPPPVTDLDLRLDCGTVEDTTPPVVTVPADKTVEATSSAGAVVTFASEVSATDDVDGPLTPTCDPESGETFPLGGTTVTCSATDTSGNEGSDSFEITVVDTTDPELTLPDDMSVNATTPSGAVVDYSPAPSATDIVDGAITPTCTPDSGSTLSIGDTTVECSATDNAGNTSEGSFNVHVKGAADQIVDLKTLVNSITSIKKPDRNELVKKLDEASREVAKGHIKPACDRLKDFINRVKDLKAPKEITVDQKNQLIADATRIRAVLGCK